MRLEDITVIVPVKNEEKNIVECLESCKSFNRIIVVDSSSKDGTQEIAKEYENVEIVNFVWNGLYPKKRNWALLNCNISTDWVLFLDADERLTDAWYRELSALDETSFDGFWLHYTNYFMGTQLKYGLAMKKLALFRYGKVFYEVSSPESGDLDMEIHEHPVGAQAVGELKSNILHNDFRGLENYLKKHIDYAGWEARRYLQNEKRGKSITWRESLKYRLIGTPIFAHLFWFYGYVIKLGFLDGKRGALFYRFKRRYYSTIYMLIKHNKC